MSLNQYFNNYTHSPTQNLFQDLVDESIKQKGIDIYYLPRNILNFDEIFGEGKEYAFANTTPIEMYQVNYSNWGGQGDMMSKFGIQLRNEATYIVSRRRFEQEMDPVRTMPQEGDLLYFPLTQSVMQITHCDHESVFWPAGSWYVWELRAELYNYDGSLINTDNQELQDEIANFPVNNTETTAPDDTASFNNEANTLINTSETNPYNWE